MRTGSAATAIALRGVDLTYGSGRRAVRAVRGVSASVRFGEATVVTGPSGSGKSSLIHLMAGLEQPTAGAVSWPGLGRNPSREPMEVGLVFQEPSLIPSLDVRENVALPLVLDGVAEAAAGVRAVAALAAIGLERLADRVPDELSGGQAQRIAVARVLAARPRIILADEPTGQLDHESARGVIDALLAAAQELGAAFVLSTHDDEVARRFPTRWTMRDGVLLTGGEEEAA
jgi:putative ABC transport system ATP-binding protein